MTYNYCIYLSDSVSADVSEHFAQFVDHENWLKEGTEGTKEDTRVDVGIGNGFM